MNRNKKIIIGLISLVLVTAIISFSVSAAFFMILNRTAQKSGIYFDEKKVSPENIKKFNEVHSILEKAYYEKIDENAMIEGAIAGMTYSLKDPYTVYFTKEQMTAFREKSEGSYVGIGVSINADADGILTIIEPFEDSPAKSAGIVRGDKIIKVDDKDVTSIKDENMVISMIKGKENTQVKITVYRPSEEKSIDFDITRKKIKITNIKSEMLPENVGYIRLVMFDSDIAKDFEDHLNKLMAKGAKGIIIDVRDNPGGSYEEVVQICDRLLPKGLIVYTEDKNKNKEEKKSDASQLEMPLAVLTNGNSASASEILSGAIKDHKKGTLIGTKTFGKGLVQTVIPLEDGSGLKVTIARYFTPSGVCIQGIGIQPDIEVNLEDKYKDTPVSQIPREEDTQLKKAVEVIKENSSEE